MFVRGKRGKNQPAFYRHAWTIIAIGQRAGVAARASRHKCTALVAPQQPPQRRRFNAQHYTQSSAGCNRTWALARVLIDHSKSATQVSDYRPFPASFWTSRSA